MKYLKKGILITFMFVAVSHINAQNIEEMRYKNVVKQLNLDHSKIKEELSTEKKMPNKEDSYIIVIPVFDGLEEEDGFSVRNTILITDGKGIIKNQYADPEEYFSDAVMLQNFTIDTGLYKLNSNIRAFGVKADYRNGSGPNPHSLNTISMYYQEGKTLKKVLNQFQIFIFGGEWDMKCAGEFGEDKSVILMTNDKNNGFANLKVKTTTTQTNSSLIGGECTEKKTAKISYETLKFNNSQYR